MNIGDYVRQKRGHIYRIKNKGELEAQQYRNEANDKENEGFIAIKSRPNIIDLIEEHDILKIEEQKGVYTICEVEAFREPYTNYDFLGVRLDSTPVARKLYELNIKSIVTKEQFESMEYKIGE